MKRIFLFCIIFPSIFLIHNLAVSGTVNVIFVNSGSEHSKVQVKAAKDYYCINSIHPKQFNLAQKKQQKVKINYASGAFSYCGWRHSHQYFSITQTDGESTKTAYLQWYKYAGGGTQMRIIKDEHNIIKFNPSDHNHPNPIKIEIIDSSAF